MRTGRVGFLGLGVMGQPMALNLAHAGSDLVVWNRTPARADPLAGAGATVAATPADVFAAAETVVVMLYDEAAVDVVLRRGGPDFASMVRDRTVVVMGTHPPAYSVGLEADLVAAGGKYVEAPVSGSRGPAETGQLVAMLSGDDPEVLARVRSVIGPMIVHAVVCGPVPAALTTKIAVNAYMITMVTGLVEAVHLADRSGLDRRVLAEALLGGPLVSPLLRGKLDKLLAEDFGVQAAVADVVKNTGLITATARTAGAATPLAVVCDELFGEAVELGLGSADLIAVLRALESRVNL
ncbi:MAG TPA: NAD(P)-dependent oxidoreductase [Microlunatus sp.]|nr:NAD(P)-dependent oxidoreductase [Microlunatus sp.]